MRRAIAILVAASATALCARFHGVWADDTAPLLTGIKAFGNWHDDAPGVRRKITAADLPPPFATESASNNPHIVQRPSGGELKVPPGFVVQELAKGLDPSAQRRTAICSLVKVTRGGFACCGPVMAPLSRSVKTHRLDLALVFGANFACIIRSCAR
jgi:hypothetical protein